jgi:hypothetical protein
MFLALRSRHHKSAKIMNACYRMQCPRMTSRSRPRVYICALASCLVTDPILPISFPRLLYIFVLKVSAQFFGPSASAESSLSAVASSPKKTSRSREGGTSKPDRQSECPTSRSSVGRVHRERGPRSGRTMHSRTYLPGSRMEYHILGSLSFLVSRCTCYDLTSWSERRL